MNLSFNIIISQEDALDGEHIIVFAEEHDPGIDFIISSLNERVFYSSIKHFTLFYVSDMFLGFFFRWL